MQESNQNCRRFSEQAKQQQECSKSSQRVRCCGRVISEQEFENEFSKNCQGKGNRMLQGEGKDQGQGKRMNQGQGKGQGQGKRMNQGQGKGQGQGKRMNQGQGKGQGQGKRQCQRSNMA